jgi:hypothetical protein
MQFLARDADVANRNDQALASQRECGYPLQPRAVSMRPAEDRWRSGAWGGRSTTLPSSSSFSWLTCSVLCAYSSYS